jgi:hypothetical protein
MQYPSQQISLWRCIMQNPTSSCFMQYPSQQISNFKSFHATSTRTEKFLHQTHFLQYPSLTNFLQNLLASDHAMCIAAKGGSGGEGEGGLEKHHCIQIGAKNHTNPSMMVAEELGSYTLTDFWVCRFVCCV